jgi:serine protease Do
VSDRLGITVQGITPAVAKALGLEKAEGAVATDVADGGPAAKAGIQVNDVILRAGKREVKQVSDFIAAMEDLQNETDIALFVKHGAEAAKWMDVKVPAVEK